jgi:hypothetical protein
VNREHFVDAIRTAVYDSTVTGTISNLSSPRGRKPKEDLVAMSKWFNGLAFHDRQQVERVIEMAAGDAVFGILCVLDGVRVIEDRPDKGVLDLRYRRGDLDVSLNDETGSMLHELFDG